VRGTINRMSEGGSNPAARRVHAIIWGEGEVPVPPELAAALSGRGIGWEEARGPFDAFARLLAARDPAIARVLLLVEPDGLAGMPEVMQGLERFDPVAGCWAYRAGITPRLAPFAPPPMPREPEIVVRQVPKPSHGMNLRLVGDGGPPPAPPAPIEQMSAEEVVEEDPEPQTPRSVLTPEELEMLLADDRD